MGHRTSYELTSRWANGFWICHRHSDETITNRPSTVCWHVVPKRRRPLLPPFGPKIVDRASRPDSSLNDLRQQAPVQRLGVPGSKSRRPSIRSDHCCSNDIKFWGIASRHTLLRTDLDTGALRRANRTLQGTDHPWPGIYRQHCQRVAIRGTPCAGSIEPSECGRAGDCRGPLDHLAPVRRKFKQTVFGFTTHDKSPLCFAIYAKFLGSTRSDYTLTIWLRIKLVCRSLIVVSFVAALGISSGQFATNGGPLNRGELCLRSDIFNFNSYMSKSRPARQPRLACARAVERELKFLPGTTA